MTLLMMTAVRAGITTVSVVSATRRLPTNWQFFYHAV